MDFDLRLLRHARALAAEGSFARAARVLHLTQPALSRSIQELERRTGLKLFDRLQGRVQPTDLGHGFLADARDLLAHAEALDRQVATMRGTGSGRLVLGSGTYPTSGFMASAIASFLQTSPAIRIRVVNDNYSVLLASLRRRELDFVVSAPPLDEECGDLDVRELTPLQGRFFVRPGHPMLARGPVSLADVADAPLISSGRLPSSISKPLIDARTVRDSGRPVPDVGCESPEMMRRITGATDHVMLSTFVINAVALESNELVPLPVVDSRIGVAFAILRLKSRTLPPVADDLIREIVAADRAAALQDRQLAARFARHGDASNAAAARRRPSAARVSAA
jgi:DNA-binding transcriptional LysR family regulator